MRNLILIVCFTLFLMLSGCAELADYTIPLPNGFRIDRLSSHQIGIYGEEPLIEHEDEQGIVYNYNYVPAKVTDIWWDDHYIIAKQVTLQSINGGVEEPNEAKYAFWLIDMQANTVYGPLDEDALTEQKQLVGVSEETKLISLDDLNELHQ